MSHSALPRPARRLRTARLVGTAVVGILGMLALITLMFIGRVGPTSLALGAQQSGRVSFPEDRLMVG